MDIIKADEIYLPSMNVDLNKWAVIACDQFTSEPEYWEKLKNYVGDAPSTLNLTLPEVYLSKDNSEMVNKINDTMSNYLNDNILRSVGRCFILVDRKTKYNEQRLGLVANIDLEKYSFNPSDRSMIRATEKTVIERIPPRVKIRKNAIMELPHILLLIDDREDKIIENLYKNRVAYKKMYDFDLNMSGGHIVGYKVDNYDEVISKFEKLINKDYVNKTFGTDDYMMFAVGDGNHSLATAKTHWDNIKINLSEEERKEHPARFAMVEIENIHDSGLTFNPIYRVVFDAKADFVEGLKNVYCGEKFCECEIITNNNSEKYILPTNCPEAVKLVQNYIDEYIKVNDKVKVDYVHGLENLKDICKHNNKAIGITLPTLNKNDLFEYVLKNGVLTRKTFSIGEAIEKRYYIEAHKIIK